MLSQPSTSTLVVQGGGRVADGALAAFSSAVASVGDDDDDGRC
jgi:hypothetical protein